MKVAEEIHRRVMNAPFVRPTLETLAKALRQNADEIKKSKSVDCVYFLGYLKTRPKDSSIPDDCLTCSRILKCIEGSN